MYLPKKWQGHRAAAALSKAFDSQDSIEPRLVTLETCHRVCNVWLTTLSATAVANVILLDLLRYPVHAADSSRDQNAQLEEVTVTAQHRTEDLQRVPISAQVVTGDALVTHNQTNLRELTQTLPAVHVNPSGPASDMYIRGVGSGGNESFDQSVGTFVDDIYHGRSRLAGGGFLDLDRIEVLKGPQSIFFGNNAIAGALNVVTKKPGGSVDASMRMLYGMYGQYAVEGAVTVPFNEQLSIRAAGSSEGGRGWIRNVDTGNNAPVDRNLAGRLTLLYKPTNDLHVTLKVEGRKDREYGVGFGGQALQTTNCPPPTPITPSAFGPQCETALAQHLPIGLHNNENTGLGGQGNVLSTDESVLTINYHRSAYDFTSVTGFTEYSFNFNWDAGGLPAPVQTVTGPEHYNQFSEELRVTSSTDQPIEYLAGAYLQTDHLAYGLERNLPELNSIVLSPSFAALAPYLPLADDELFSQDEQSYAVFASLAWKATKTLKLSAGLRGVSNRKAADVSSYWGAGTQLYGGFVQNPLPVTTLEGSFFGRSTPATQGAFSRTDRALLPSAKIQYQMEADAITYFSAARGFLAGGFNGTDSTNVRSNVPFNPEYVNAYEVGLKSKWFDSTVLLNLDVFRSDYSNLQVSDFVAGSTGANGVATPGYQAIRNAADSRSQGLEFEGQWAAGQHLRLSANVTYLEAYYSNYPNGPATLAATVLGIETQSLSGRPTLFAPRWSGSVTGAYNTSLPGDYRFTSELICYFTTGYFLQGDAADDPLLYQGGYVRWDSHLSFQNPDGHWVIDLIGRNLTNRVIVTTFGGPFLAAKEEPANFAVQFRYRW
jgi:iron complex outermembrane receptor protein